jgi:hypothetical protein
MPHANELYNSADLFAAGKVAEEDVKQIFDIHRPGDGRGRAPVSEPLSLS